MQIQVHWAPQSLPMSPQGLSPFRNVSWVPSCSERGDFSQMSCLKTHSSLPLTAPLFSFQSLCTSLPDWVLWSLFCHYYLSPQESAMVPHCYQNTNPLVLHSKPRPASVFLTDFILLCSLGWPCEPTCQLHVLALDIAWSSPTCCCTGACPLTARYTPPVKSGILYHVMVKALHPHNFTQLV